jgi:hypothetical protein
MLGFIVEAQFLLTPHASSLLDPDLTFLKRKLICVKFCKFLFEMV